MAIFFECPGKVFQASIESVLEKISEEQPHGTALFFSSHFIEL